MEKRFQLSRVSGQLLLKKMDQITYRFELLHFLQQLPVFPADIMIFAGKRNVVKHMNHIYRYVNNVFNQRELHRESNMQLMHIAKSEK
jgi:hypothetical protein